MRRLLLVACALGAMSAPGLTRQAAPREGQPQAGPTLKMIGTSSMRARAAGP